MDVISIIVTWLVVTASLVIVSKIPGLGVEIDNLKKALISGAVFGVLNAAGTWVLGGIPPIFLGLFWLIINVIVFGLAAKIVVGFRLRMGIWSAILGAIFMTIVLSIVRAIVGIFIPIN